MAPSTYAGLRVENNTADLGGGAYITAGANTFTGSTITGNHAITDGGGVYFDGSRSATLALSTVGVCSPAWPPLRTFRTSWHNRGMAMVARQFASQKSRQ